MIDWQRVFRLLVGSAAVACPAIAQDVTTLPKPTGNFAVAVRRFEWADGSRKEMDSAHAALARRLVARVWYPAQAVGSAAAYLPLAERYAAARILSERTADRMSIVLHHASEGGAVATSSQRFPLLIFSGGNGEIEVMYTALMEELASHGVVIAQVIHPGVAHAVFSNGDVVRRYRRLYDPKPEGWDAALKNAGGTLNRAVYDSFYVEAASYLLKDISFVIDEMTKLNDGADGGWLRGKLDMNHVATAGHSYGALVASEACGRDQRVRACVLFDGATFGALREQGLSRPVMLFRPAWINDRTGRGISQDQMFGSLKADGYDVNIPGAEHRSFMDAHFLNPSSRSTPADPARVLEIVSAYTRAFLGFYLGKRPSPLLAGPAPSFRDVHLRIFRNYLPPAPAN